MKNIWFVALLATLLTTVFLGVSVSALASALATKKVFHTDPNDLENGKYFWQREGPCSREGFDAWGCYIAEQGLEMDSFGYQYQTYMNVPKTCVPALKALDKLIYNYGDVNGSDFPKDNSGKKELRRDDSILRSDISAIEKILDQAERKKPACFQTLATFYALDIYSTVRGRQTWGLAETLAIHDKFHAIGHSERSRLDGYWRQKLTNTNEYLVFGAYDCSEAKIYFDPYKAPLDLAGTMDHELNHFLRDKFFSSDTSSIPVRELLVSDEMAATLSGAISQVDNTARQEKRGTTNFPQFDAHLYSRHGVLVQLYRAWFALDPAALAMEDWDSLQEILTFSLASPGGQKMVNRIFQLVMNGYFPSLSSRPAVFPKQLLAQKLNYFEPVSPDFGSFGVEFFKSKDGYSSAPDDQSPDWKRVYISASPFLEPPAQKFLDRLIGSLNQPSTSCSRFQNDVRSGLLADYLGTKLSSPGTRVTPLKPGSEGVMPGRFLRPGNEGVMPGRSLKPGIEGVMPGRTGIQPCISLGGDF